jgi:hypothetical protein
MHGVTGTAMTRIVQPARVFGVLALVGGELAVWSKVGVGTEVELRLPAWSVYTIARRRSWIDRLRASDTPGHGDQEVS